MKKIMSVILTLMLTIVISSAVYAAKGAANIPDKPVPGAPAQNVNNATYNPPEVEIPNNIIPGGAAKITDNKVPGGAATTDIKDVKTGGVPAGTFYAAGGLMVAAALVISFKKTAKN